MKNRASAASGDPAPGVVVDLEWDPDENDGAPLCIGFALEGLRPKVVRMNLLRPDERELIERSTIIEHSNSDAVKLLDHGWTVGDVINTMVLAWLLNENQQLDLESLMWRYCHVRMDKRILRTGKRVLFKMNNGKYVPIYRAPRAQLHDYCKRDVVGEQELFEELRERLQDQGLWDYFIDEELPYTRLLIDMSRAGLPIDIERSEKLRARVEKEHTALEDELRDLANAPAIFNLSSPDQVAAFLFSNEVHVKGRISLEDYEADRIPELFWPDEPSGKEKLWIQGEWIWAGLELEPGDLSENTGQPSTSREALLLNDATRETPWVKTYLEWHRLHTALTTFLRVFPVKQRDGRIRSNFKQTGTKTGRLSSSDINLQNIPARTELGHEIRDLFRTPDELPFLMGDFSQLETRLMAHFSQDPELLRIFRENEDPFIALGSKIYGKQLTKDDPERGATKNVWYANGYGAMPPKMWRMITLDGVDMTVQEVEDLWNELQGILPIYFEWRDFLIEDARNKGYVTTLGGRRRRIKFTKAMSWKEEGHGERAAANAKVQGSAADYVRRTMCGWSRPWLMLCAQVHDELLFQYLKKLNITRWSDDRISLQQWAESGVGYDLTVPMVFDAKIATSWADK